MGVTSIEWTDRSVNPIRARLGTAVGHHCEKVSQGCANCYASRLQPRFKMPPFQADRRTDVEPFFDAARLNEVLTRRIPTKWFWCDMSDLFGAWVPDEWIDQCFAVMALTPHHIHQVLTKRPERMLAYMNGLSRYPDGHCWAGVLRSFRVFGAEDMLKGIDLPLRNVWLGVSVENQATADARIPLLLQTPAAVRFISAEPLLGPINLHRLEHPDDGCHASALQRQHDDNRYEFDNAPLDWVIVGGESGPGARPCDIAWVRSIVAQCKAAGVPAFVKQLGADPRGICDWEHHDVCLPKLLDKDGVLTSVSGHPGTLQHAVGDAFWPCRLKLRSHKGGDPSEWPADLRVRQFPEGR